MKSMFKQVKKHPVIAGIGSVTVLSFFGKTAGFTINKNGISFNSKEDPDLKINNKGIKVGGKMVQELNAEKIEAENEDLDIKGDFEQKSNTGFKK